MDDSITMTGTATGDHVTQNARTDAGKRGVSPQGSAGCSCGTGAATGMSGTPSYVYALGRIHPRFPTAGIEKEFAQIVGRSNTAGLPDSQLMHAVCHKPENRYLARHICWIFSIEGVETYLLIPRCPMDLDLLIEAIRSGPRSTDVDAIIGLRGPIAPPEMCNGLQLPTVTLDQLYSFDFEGLLKAIPRPESIPEDSFAATAECLFHRIMQMADNAGNTDEHRALNYLAVRYSAIYGKAAEAHGRNASLSSVEVRPSRLSSTRKIVDVIFTFTNRTTDIAESFFVRVDVTEVFPFLVTKILPFYDR